MGRRSGESLELQALSGSEPKLRRMPHVDSDDSQHPNVCILNVDSLNPKFSAVDVSNYAILIIILQYRIMVKQPQGSKMAKKLFPQLELGCHYYLV